MHRNSLEICNKINAKKELVTLHKKTAALCTRFISMHHGPWRHQGMQPNQCLPYPPSEHRHQNVCPRRTIMRLDWSHQNITNFAVDMSMQRGTKVPSPSYPPPPPTPKRKFIFVPQPTPTNSIPHINSSPKRIPSSPPHPRLGNHVK